MDWRKIEAALLDMAREYGWVVEQGTDGNWTVLNNVDYSFEEIAQELAKRLSQ